jgi:intein-encoded DNA endonuclease-like protein
MTSLEQLIQFKLGKPVKNWVKQNAKGQSYRSIAEAITEEAGVQVSKSTIHLWLKK